MRKHTIGIVCHERRDYEKEFPERMFDYHVAVRQLYNQRVVGLAILCDDRPDWRPTTFEYELWGCKTVFTFRIAKLLDQLPNVDALETSDNPFAAVVLAHLQTMQTRGDPLTRKQWKLRLAKGLFQRNWSGDDIRQLLRLIDWFMALPDEMVEAFRTEIHQYEEEKTVPYVTSFERFAKKEGLEQGKREGLLEGIELALDVRFGAAGRKLLRKARDMTIDDLREFARFVQTAETLAQVREYLK